MDEDRKFLSQYRIGRADETLAAAKTLLDNGQWKDSINRSYYAAFHAVRSILALEGTDFKKHKDVIGYFNKSYVATEKINKDIGRKIAGLSQKREKSDYDDFFVASEEEAKKQYESACEILEAIRDYLSIDS